METADYAQPGRGPQARKLISVGIDTTPTFRAGAATTLFESVDLASGWGRSYDVAPDGQRFLMTISKEQRTNLVPTEMIFVQNWFEELKRLVPAK
ncbi:MAG: hypothetical protein ABIX28_06270 [Vicinamibacterales bacterium]